MSNALLLAAEQASELPAPPELFGLGALVAFLALLGLLWSFRNTSNRHR